MELLSKDIIKRGLSNESIHSISRIDVFDSITSTNTYLLRGIDQGIPAGSLCVADAQTEGRGRQGRVWHSPSGTNLYCSLYWRFEKQSETLPCITLVAGTAIADAVVEHCGLLTGLGVKWPNDLYYQNKKICGVLVESKVQERSDGSKAWDVVIGFGLNVLSASDTSFENAGSLEQSYSIVFSRNTLLSVIVNKLISYLHQFETAGFSSFMTQWDHHDFLKGALVGVRFPDGKLVEGIYRGIDSSGGACIEIESVIKTFMFGEIQVRPHAIIS